MTDNPIISIRDLSIAFPLKRGTLTAVKGANFDIPKGKITALVGESGSGKSTLASGILQYVSTPGKFTGGTIHFNGENVLDFDKQRLGKYRWRQVSMVFQAAQNSLNPVMTIKEQMIETYRAHVPRHPEKAIIAKAQELLSYVRLEPERVLDSYPHELSGGMKQRVMIAFSLLLQPELVILDEPTTALDVITQDYIFDILQKVHRNLDVTMLLLTHDMGVVAKVADYVGVMYAGEIVEMGDVYTLFEDPKHPYTQNLLEASPSLVGDMKEKTAAIGDAPDVFNLPMGCGYQKRCMTASKRCAIEKPQMTVHANGTLVSCHLYQNEEGAIYEIQ